MPLRIARPDNSPAGFLRITGRTRIAYTPLALIWLTTAQYTRDALLPAPAGQTLPHATALTVLLLWGWTPLMVLLRRDSPAPHEHWSDTVNHAVPVRPPGAVVGSPPVPSQGAPAAGPEPPAPPLPAGHRAVPITGPRETGEPRRTPPV
ncbi:hypothetical protein [Streptomyces antibioticus]|uniref:hypothetical protein n=1 Tax=Streptomyces antibioticus TaxID=1890 RepID=UPI0033E848BF